MIAPTLTTPNFTCNYKRWAKKTCTALNCVFQLCNENGCSIFLLRQHPTEKYNVDMVKLSTFNKKITLIKLELDNKTATRVCRDTIVSGHKSYPQKRKIYTGMCVQYKKIQRFLRYSPKTELIICHHVVNNGLNIKGQKLIQGQSPPKAHLHPLRDVCMQYENNPANGLREIVWKQNLISRH